MKKFITIAALILGALFIFSATSVFAQYAYFGVKAGVNIATWRGDDADLLGSIYEKKPRIGFVGGVYSTIVLAKIFALQPELLFTMAGTKYKYDEFSEYDYYTLKLNYIQLPVLLKFYIPMPGNVKPTIFAGPYGSYNVSDKYYNEWYLPSTVWGEGDYDGDISDDFMEVQKFDYGVVFGIGVDFIIFSDKQLTVDARYNLGLANVFDADPLDDPDIKNGTISAMVGIGF